MTHCRSGSDAPNALWIWGSATFTIVTSSSSMNMPANTTVSVHHLRAIRSPHRADLRGILFLSHTIWRSYHMNQTPSDDPGAVPHRGQLNQAVRESLRDLSIQMSLLSNRIGGHLDLKGTDLECLDLIDRYGPLRPSALARRAGLHPATMTGILDRLERDGWIVPG